MAAYDGQWRLICDQPVPPALVAQARKLVGGMLQIGGVMSKFVRNPDNSTIRIVIAAGIPQVTVTLPSTSAKEQSARSTLWVPRGFVVYPAFKTAPFGYGLPVIQQGDDPYSAANLSPGLDVTRWTAGGPCGEVLVSPDAEAGYPPLEVVPAPLLADATKGPQFLWPGTGNYDARKPDGTWQSYRAEFAPFQAYYADENPATQQALFEGLNVVRAQAGQLATTLRFKGFAHVAELAASIMVTAGSDADVSSDYPTTYASSYDRITKEGYGVDWYSSKGVIPKFDRTQDYSAVEFRAVGQSPNSALSSWQNSASGYYITEPFGSCSVADVGYRGGYSVLTLSARDHWIQAGNASWQSPDTTLPPISWHSFASVNLAWETYPAAYTYTMPPLSPAPYITDSVGDFYLFYPRGVSGDTSTVEPALGRHIYSRGRSIALAPNGGLIWGACVAASGDNDRLIALVHDPADQPSDVLNNGFTRYLRVWWADIPKRSNGLRLAPQLTICGTDVEDPWGWRGGQLIDLGNMPAATGFAAADAVCNSLKYASCWRFSPDGLHAVCLRDYGALVDYGAPDIGMQDYGVARYEDGGPLINQGSSTGNAPRTVELTFFLTANDLNTTISVSDNAPYRRLAGRSRTSPPLTDDGALYGVCNGFTEYAIKWRAVDFDAHGALVYLSTAVVMANSDFFITANNDDGYIVGGHGLFYVYAGIGGFDAQYLDDMTSSVLVGATLQTPSVDSSPSGLVVEDVQTSTFVSTSTRPRYAIELIPGGDPKIVGGAVHLIHSTASCPLFTSAPVFGAQMYAGGKQVADDWYSNPDGVLCSVNDVCTGTSGQQGAPFVDLSLAASAMVQGYYAVRFNETVYGYQVMPLVDSAWILSSPPASGACGCWYTISDYTAATQLSVAQAAPRGGRLVSSMPMPANDWLIYAKVV